MPTSISSNGDVDDRVESVLIYGHGGAGTEGLNHAASFPAVAASGADGVELDVRLSADQKLIVIHDPDYGDGRAVADVDAADRPTEVIDLATALDLCRGLIVNIELKNYPQDPAFDPEQRLVDNVIDLIEARAGEDRVLLSCFGIAALDHARDRRRDLTTAHLVLSRRPAEETVAVCVGHGHRVIHPYESMVDDTFMAVARSHDLAVNVWTGPQETAKSIEHFRSLGVHGLITARPGRAVAVLRG